METLEFICPACNKTLKMQARFAGRTGRCPHCNTKLIVPQPDEAQQSKTEQPDTSAPKWWMPGKFGHQPPPSPVSEAQAEEQDAPVPYPGEDENKTPNTTNRWMQKLWSAVTLIAAILCAQFIGGWCGRQEARRTLHSTRSQPTYDLDQMAEEARLRATLLAETMTIPEPALTDTLKSFRVPDAGFELAFPAKPGIATIADQTFYYSVDSNGVLYSCLISYEPIDDSLHDAYFEGLIKGVGMVPDLFKRLVEVDFVPESLETNKVLVRGGEALSFRYVSVVHNERVVSRGVILRVSSNIYWLTVSAPAAFDSEGQFQEFVNSFRYFGN